jgi:hypothetical protein
MSVFVSAGDSGSAGCERDRNASAATAGFGVNAIASTPYSGLRFRNEIISGPGGSQIILDDPFGNPIGLFQPAPY